VNIRVDEVASSDYSGERDIVKDIKKEHRKLEKFFEGGGI